MLHTDICCISHHLATYIVPWHTRLTNVKHVMLLFYLWSELTYYCLSLLPVFPRQHFTC